MQPREKILLLIIFFFAFTFRIIGINWDHGYNIHPDERAIIMNVLSLSAPHSIEDFFSPDSPLNTKFFAYGNMPFYLLKFILFLFSFIHPYLAMYESAGIVGRGIISVLELGTILLIFLISRRLWNTHIGLIASAIYALSVFPIQISHFYTVDPFLSFFMLLTVFNALRLYESPSIRYALFTGVSLGSAFASKISAFPVLAPLALAIFFLLLKSNKRLSLQLVMKNAKQLYKQLLILACSAVLIWIATQPYVIIDFSTFWRQTLEQSQMTKSAFTFPYTLQYVGKIPYLYELKNVFLWGLGPVIATLSGIGFILFISQLRNSIQKKENLILLSFFFIYFLIVGSFAVGWMRYMLPLYPYFAIFAALALDRILVAVEKKRLIYIFLSTILAIGIAYWPVSFLNIYLEPHTRFQATDWILKNIPRGSTLAVEHWDDRLPTTGVEKYSYEELALYEQDSKEKWEMINSQLKRSDYIIIASNRLYVPLQKLTDCTHLPPGRCYPQTAAYYKKLFHNKLGFKKIKEFSVTPIIPILNIPINDQSADESFTVYDHPKIIIFKKNQ